MAQLGYEAAGGAVEKFLSGVSFPLLMNAVLPGALAAAALLPFTPLRSTSFLSLSTDKIWPALAIAAVAVAGLGGLVSSLNSELYKVYEGRIFWPRRLFDRAVARQQRRVESLYLQAGAEKGVNEKRYDEIWYRLRVYPFDRNTGRRHATHPTLLGNILAGYEQYSYNCYGMDSVFYWPRLWLLVDKDNREEIGKSWAVADGLLNLSAVSFLAGLLWGCAVAGAAFDFWPAPRLYLADQFTASWLAVAIWLALGYGFYRLSLPFHRQNGEVFKSLFDLYRDKLRKITSLAPNEAKLWTATWAYLQYLKVLCPSCKTGYFSLFDTTCGNPQCGADHFRTVEELHQTGQFVSVTKEKASAKEDLRALLRELQKALDDEK